jgi:hypothetical protein
MMRVLLLVFLLASVGEALAGNTVVLKGPDILATLSGKTVRGAYADGTAFTETFWPDGKDTYWDPRGPTTGHWSVARDLMCFEYDSEFNMTGGCFRIERYGANCFDFYGVSQSMNDPAPAQKKPRYVARASVDGAEGTCPVELQV